MLQWLNGSMAQWLNGSMAQWLNGSMAQWLKFRKRALAFTLLEVIITLSYLGVIATYAIPKVLTARQDAQRKAVFKETIAALSDLSYKAAMSDPFYASAGNPAIITYFQSRLNHTKSCATNMLSEGCKTINTTGWTYWGSFTGGFNLHNGACIMIWGSPNDSIAGVI